MQLAKETGENAGKVWHALRQHGAQTVVNLETNTELREESIYRAIGWLTRENKVEADGLGSYAKYALTPAEMKQAPKQ